jgi:hypothetical protein
VRYLAFFVIVLAVLGAGYAYLGWRLTTVWLEDRRRWRRALWIALAALIVIPFASFALLVGRKESPLIDAFAWVGFGCLGFASLLFTLVVMRDLSWLAVFVYRRLAARWSGASQPTSPERRKLLLSTLNASKVGVSGLMFGYGLSNARTVAEVVEIDVPIEGLHDDLVGFRIAQITDLHVGATIKADYVRAVVERVNGLQPDLVALTGDLVDGSVDYLDDDVAPLGDLESRHGGYVCTGNHEYYSGVKHWLEHFRALALVPLVNEHRVIQHGAAKLIVAGVTDVREGQREPGHDSDPERALAGAPPADLRLLLAHQPRSVIAAERAGFDLQVSGHTHGGQFFPWNFFAHLGQPYVAGLHRHGRTWIYVSCGTGYWGPPLRIGVPSEITLIRLVRG